MKTYLLFLMQGCLMLLATTGCKKNSIPATTGEKIHLETAVWQLTSILACPDPMSVPESLPVPLTIKFDKGRIEGFGGCNGFGGEFTANRDRITVSGLVHTEMYCEGVSEWENRFLETLTYAESYKITGETLEILSGDMGGLVFRLNWKKRNAS